MWQILTKKGLDKNGWNLTQASPNNEGFTIPSFGLKFCIFPHSKLVGSRVHQAKIYRLYRNENSATFFLLQFCKDKDYFKSLIPLFKTDQCVSFERFVLHAWLDNQWWLMQIKEALRTEES